MAKADYIRRCHVCGTISQEEKRVERCSGCGICIAPFFYFDETKVATFSDSLLRPPLIPGEYAPLIGISVVWKQQN